MREQFEHDVVNARKSGGRAVQEARQLPAVAAGQMPLSVVDAHFRSFEKEVLPVLVREQIGVLGMKSMGSGSILRSKTVSAIECLHYVLNLPTSVVITGIDSMERLDQAIEAVKTFKPLTQEQVKALLTKTA